MHCTSEPGQSLTEAVTYIRVIVTSCLNFSDTCWQTGPQDLQTLTRDFALS